MLPTIAYRVEMVFKNQLIFDFINSVGLLLATSTSTSLPAFHTAISIAAKFYYD